VVGELKEEIKAKKLIMLAHVKANYTNLISMDLTS